MGEQALIQIISETVYLVFIVSAPLLAAALIVGLLVSVFQVVTSIQDMTLTFIPRMAVVCLLTLALMPWIIDKISAFTLRLLSQFSTYAQ
ncbi:MAG: flagellar biosynthesis protein FliQ [Acidobacteriota bacterium]|jgi:flagellar biosynthetic protein FliQ